MKNFVKRNFVDVAAVGFFVAVCMLALVAYIVLPKEPAPMQPQGASISVPGGRLSLTTGVNCTPFFNQSALASFSYNISGSYTGSGPMRVEQVPVGLDPDSGLVVVRLNFTVRGNSLHVVRYLDGNSLKCAKQVLLISGAAGSSPFTQVSDCAEQQLFFEGACAEKMRAVGGERITVPAGEFEATRYVESDTNASFWVASGVSVPVKFEMVGTRAELVSFQIFNKTW